MTTSNTKLSSKDEEFRAFALNGNLWRVIFHVCTPLALYQSLNQLFKILDSMMAAYISASSVSTVAYLSQINFLISSLGGGLAIGAGLKISQAYGAGNYELVKKRVSTLFGMCLILGSLIFVILIPFAPQFLRLAQTPEEFITIGTEYFRIDIISVVIGFFNNVYIAIEQARGNSKRILKLNFLVIALKLSITAIFVYVLNGTITMISVATVIPQVVMLIAAIINLNQKDNAFGFSLKSISFNKKVTAPMLSISIPVIVEKAAFTLGKVIVNSMSTIYGSLTVGALGISNNFGGFTTCPQLGFQEGGAAIISQNLGANQPKRALETFKHILLINIMLGIVLMSTTLIFLPQLSQLFSSQDSSFGDLIATIYRYEACGAIFLGINSSVLSLLYGFGRTRCTLLINFCRVFLFRIPILWALQQYTNLGSQSVGIVMAVSNILTGLFSLIIATIIIRQICRVHKITFRNKKA